MEADEKAGKPWDTQRVVREYARAPLCFHPGEHWRYGFSIDVLGALVEVMSGMKLGEFMKNSRRYPTMPSASCRLRSRAAVVACTAPPLM